MNFWGRVTTAKEHLDTCEKDNYAQRVLGNHLRFPLERFAFTKQSHHSLHMLRSGPIILGCGAFQVPRTVRPLNREQKGTLPQKLRFFLTPCFPLCVASAKALQATACVLCKLCRHFQTAGNRKIDFLTPLLPWLSAKRESSASQ